MKQAMRDRTRRMRHAGDTRGPRLSPRLLLLPLLFLLTACGDPTPTRAALSVAETLADTDTAGYARATEPRTFRFPADHGPHPAYKHEWWYFTGNLEAANREFGFQLTFFRSALRPDTAVTIQSPWAASQAYMAHFAITDIEPGAFHAFERFDRGALGLAGAVGGADAPMRVWIGDWEAAIIPAPGSSSTDGLAFRIRARDGGVALDLVLVPTRPIVLQGEDGLSRKGPEPGNASYYYSVTRLEARGTLLADGAEHAVRGLAWLDREWGTSALSPGIAGWDWFALQLDDHSALMLYRLRTDHGDTAPFSAGTFIAPDGTVTRIAADDFVLEELGTWSSPRGGRYPSEWRVRVPGLDLIVDVRPRLADQELDLAFRYWEGAVAVVGRREGRAVAGKGYVELTGHVDGRLR